jgi:hypothetical protein
VEIKQMINKKFLEWNPLEGDPEWEKLKAQGWEYKDTPKMSTANWEKMMHIFGKENVDLLTLSSGRDKERAPWVRGQFLVSAQGMTNLRAYNAKHH